MRQNTVNVAKEFLTRYEMLPELVDPAVYARLIAEDMLRGLEGKDSFMPMIPTYLSNSGNVPKNEPVVVIDAGGTNFRCALLTFTDQGYELEGLQKALMPGIEKPATWKEFISFTADHIIPFHTGNGPRRRRRSGSFCRGAPAPCPPPENIPAKHSPTCAAVRQAPAIA